MNIFFKLCLTINSLLFSFVVFLVDQSITLQKLGLTFFEYPNYSSYIIYIAIILLLNIFILWLKQFLGNDTLPSDKVVSIEPANDAFLPTYLGYFFVALSVNSLSMFLFVFGIISLFIFSSRISYFNPFLFLHGYHFYYVASTASVKTLIISRKKIKTKTDADFTKLKRVNDYTFFDMED